MEFPNAVTEFAAKEKLEIFKVQDFGLEFLANSSPPKAAKCVRAILSIDHFSFMQNADLHTHSYYSADSDISPEELVVKAKSVGLKHIALTDHDSVKGIEEFLAAGKKHKINTISGVELHSEWGEILGYFIDHKNENLQKFCKANKQLINQRAEDIIKKLDKDGYQLNPAEMREKYKREILERSMIVAELVEKGYAQSRQEAFENFLNKGKKYYVKSNFPSTVEVIKTITASGGEAVLSHPHVQDYQSQFKNMEKLIKAGLVGIECLTILDKETPSHYPKNTNQITKQIKQLAKKHNLILTSGSDYHGTILPLSPFGSCNCDESVVVALKKAVKKL